MNKRHRGIPTKILKDKRIKPEGKLIYSYIYSKGQDRIITDLNVGELQQVVNHSALKVQSFIKLLKVGHQNKFTYLF